MLFCVEYMRKLLRSSKVKTVLQKQNTKTDWLQLKKKILNVYILKRFYIIVYYLLS